MTDASGPPPGLAIPAAARDQGDVQLIDYELAELARLRHPAARWWWGARVIEGDNGAYCYLCNKLVTTWYRAWPITRRAVEAILAHRPGHVDAGRPSIGYRAPAIIAGDGAPPAGGQD